MKLNRRKCSLESCTGYVYAKNLCPYHYRISYSKPIRKRSKKRAKQEKEYSINREKFIENKRDDKGRIFCIFCNQEIYGNPDLHHALGRDEDLLLDEKYWYLSHRDCHDKYHHSSCDNISWWTEYTTRIALIDKDLLAIELKRTDKASIL